MFLVLILLQISLLIRDVSSITDGYVAEQSAFGFVASIWTNGVLRCTGGIIHPRYILTAAICVKDIPLHTMSIGTGKVGLYDVGLHFSTVERVVIHPDFTVFVFGVQDLSVNTINNIAVLKLSAALQLGSERYAISLANNKAASCVCQISGWSSGWGPMDPSRHLVHFFANPLTPLECLQRGALVLLNHFCAIDLYGMRSISLTDIGGIFVSEGKAFGIIVGSVARPAPAPEVIILPIYPYLSFLFDVLKGVL
ncbi:serine protease 29-like [Diachasmimorpha longicaudata]|uniref:serine protease 29-like n=1 Tax=Diachasmimorpha longicaudata TaxID=58733 RepID=UPI0030B89049